MYLASVCMCVCAACACMAPSFAWLRTVGSAAAEEGHGRLGWCEPAKAQQGVWEAPLVASHGAHSSFGAGPVRAACVDNPPACCATARLPAANLQDIPNYPAKYNVKTLGAKGDGNAGANRAWQYVWAPGHALAARAWA